MSIVVIGGHTRNIGKTSVVAGLIAALPHFHWTALKITQYGHGVCSANGEPSQSSEDDDRKESKLDVVLHGMPPTTVYPR